MIEVTLMCTGCQEPHTGNTLEVPEGWLLINGNEVWCSEACKNPKPLSLKHALRLAYEHGTKAAEGYREGLLSMNSSRTVGGGDEAKARVFEAWPTLANQLVHRLRASGYGNRAWTRALVRPND